MKKRLSELLMNVFGWCVVIMTVNRLPKKGTLEAVILSIVIIIIIIIIFAAGVRTIATIVFLKPDELLLHKHAQLIKPVGSNSTQVNPCFLQPHAEKGNIIPSIHPSIQQHLSLSRKLKALLLSKQNNNNNNNITRAPKQQYKLLD